MNKVEIHHDICERLNDLYNRKNHDYGDSFGKSYAEYGMTMACIRLEDKLNRLKSLTKKTQMVSDESIEDTLMDLANYSIMTLVERSLEEKKQDNTPKCVSVPLENPSKRGDHSMCDFELYPDCPCKTCKHDSPNCCFTHAKDCDKSCPDYEPEEGTPNA